MRICSVIFAASQIAALVVCGSVIAADLPTDKPAEITQVAPPATFSWTGLYVGVNGGFALDHYAFVYALFPPGSVGSNGSSEITSSGPVFGGQIGYNYELTNLPVIAHAVIGIEADSDWAGVAGSTIIAIPGATYHVGTRFENFGTARLRLGYDFDRLLLYFTGGLSYATVQNYYNSGASSGSLTETHSGFFPRIGVVGIGAEYAITEHFSVKAEYLYDFNGARYSNFSSPPGYSIGFGDRAMYHIARVGLNYKFDLFSGAPATAKY
jgi:outer membrane immunogenic protein